MSFNRILRNLNSLVSFRLTGLLTSQFISQSGCYTALFYIESTKEKIIFLTFPTLAYVYIGLWCCVGQFLKSSVNYVSFNCCIHYTRNLLCFLEREATRSSLRLWVVFGSNCFPEGFGNISNIVERGFGYLCWFYVRSGLFVLNQGWYVYDLLKTNWLTIAFPDRKNVLYNLELHSNGCRLEISFSIGKAINDQQLYT